MNRFEEASASFFIDYDSMFDEPAFRVFLYAMVTAVATGLGALPFFFVKEMPKKWLGWSGGVASGIMLAASFRLINEGISYDLLRNLRYQPR